MDYVAPDFFPIENIPRGTTLLISGPPLTRKRELMMRLLASGSDSEGVLITTTKKGAGEILSQFRTQTDTHVEKRLQVIDCVSKERGIGSVRETDVTSYVSSPRDLTGLSIKLSGRFKGFYEQDISTRVGLHSLSTFLMYHDLQRVYRMVHVMSGQIETAGWFGGFVVDSPTDRELDILSQLVDGLVQTRETDDGYEFRLRGLGTKTGWQPY